MNKVEQHITDTGHMRWAYPKATYFWFVGGHSPDAVVTERIRYRLMRDVQSLTSAMRKRGLTAVALITATSAAAPLQRMLTKIPSWRTIVLGPKAINVADPDAVCAKTADFVMCYGTPSDELLTLLESMESPPEILRRNPETPGRERQIIRPRQTNPYSGYEADVTRLSRVRQSPTHGLQVRDEIDMRPKYTV